MKQCPSCSAQYGDEVGFCDTDGKATTFAFDKHRRIEHYGPITAQTGVILPD